MGIEDAANGRGPRRWWLFGRVAAAGVSAGIVAGTALLVVPRARRSRRMESEPAAGFATAPPPMAVSSIPSVAAAAAVLPPPAATPPNAGFLSRAVPALRYRDFRLLIAGVLVSMTGYWVMFVTQAWLAFEITSSNTWVGIVGSAETLPVLAISLWAGVLADRTDRKRLMMIVRTLVSLLMLGEALLAAAGLIDAYVLVAFALALGTLTALDIPARQTLVTDLVPPEHIDNGVAVQQSTWNVTSILGPSVGAVLLAFAGPAWAFAATAGASAFLVAVVAAMRIPRRPPAAHEESMLRQAWAGLRFVSGNAIVGWLLVLALIMTTFWSGYFVLLPALAGDIFGAGETGYGAMNSASGAGALVGSLAVVALSRRRRRRGLLLIGGAVLMCFSLMGVAYSPSLLVAAGILFVVGLTGDVYYTLSNTVIITTTPEELRGRVMSVQTFIWGLSPVGSLAAGIIADQSGVRMTFLVCGAVALAATLMIYGTRGDLRRL